MVYWLVALPAPSTGMEGAWASLQEDTTYSSDLSVNFKFAVPEFKVGTLDSLLGLSDDLVKVNGAVEGSVNKVRRQLFELQSAAPTDRSEEEEGGEVRVEGTSPPDYLQHFEWQEAKYPSKRPLKDTVAAITEVTQKLDDDLKVRGAGWDRGPPSAMAWWPSTTPTSAAPFPPIPPALQHPPPPSLL